MNSSDSVALVAPATFPQVALLAPTGDGETVLRVTDGVVTNGTNGPAYTPYAGAQVLAVPPMMVFWAVANPASKRSRHRTESLRIEILHFPGLSQAWVIGFAGGVAGCFQDSPRIQS